MKKFMLSSFYAFLVVFQQEAFSQTYALPYRGEDLQPGERLFTTVHNPGIQGEGKDIIMMRYVENNIWTKLKEGNGTKNTDFLVRERAVYALADGVITGCWANAPENLRPRLPEDTDEGQEWLHPKVRQLFKEMPRGGNLLWIKHADGSKALYAHMIPGTITAKLCANQAALFPKPLDTTESENIYVNLPAAKQVKVVKGQFLGRTGSSGQASEPHLHIHIEKSGQPQIMKFEEGLSKGYIKNNTTIQNGWTSFASQQIPNMEVLIRPPRAVSFRMRDFETLESGGNQIFVGIFEPGNYPPSALFENDWDKFLKGWKEIEAQGFRMIDFECFTINGFQRFSGVFEKASYPPIALVKDNWDEFLKGWKEIEVQGNRMMDFETYMTGSKRMYVGIFKPGNYAPVALFKDDWDEFLKGWKEIEAQGNRMQEFETYMAGAKRMYVGVFKPGNYAPVALFKENWDDFLKGWKELEVQGNRMLDFESYLVGTKRMYVGVFKPGNYVPVALFKNNWDEFLEGWQNLE
jgi:hypothetical protein